MSKSKDMQSLEKMAEAVTQKRPGMRNILKKHGNLSVADYAGKYADSHKNVPDKLKREFVDSITRSTAALFGKTEAETIQKNVLETYFALTGDHHGPLTHPFFLNSALLTALSAPTQTNILVLSSSNVSLNNSSHPRGLLYNSDLGLVKINLLPAKNLMCPVYSVRAFSLENIEQHLDFFKGAGLEQIFTDEKILNQKRYGDQVSLINRHLWPKFFPKQNLPKLVYLELEKIVVDLLLRHHLQTKTIIHEIIFNAKLRQLFVKNFEHIPGSFGDNKGTVLFWFLPKNSNKRIGLRTEGNYFISLDKMHKIKIAPAQIKKLLASGELIPSTIFALLIVSAYYGVKCLGGFSQTTYLTHAQTLYNRVFLASGPDKEPHTQTLGADIIIAYIKKAGKLIPATGLDLILFRNEKSWHNFKQTANSITLKEAFYPMLPLLHKELYPDAPNNLGIEEIIAALNIKHKIRPIGAL